MGFKGKLTYKPDIFTYLGIYRGNKFGIMPNIYTSKYEGRRRLFKSKIDTRDNRVMFLLLKR